MKVYFTLFRKNITRFFPLWGGGMLLFLLTVTGFWYRYSLPINLYAIAGELLICSIALYGLATAIFLWSDMLSQKRSGMLYSMPITRTGIFLTQFFTGILFGLALLPGLIYIYHKHPSDYIWPLLYLYLLLYGIGTFSVMLSGNPIGAALLSISVLCLPVAARWMFEAMFMPYLPGVGIDNTTLIQGSSRSILNNLLSNSSLPLLGLLGLLLAAVGFALFLFRKPETTGQFTTHALIRYFFCAAASLVASTLLFLLLKQDAKTEFWSLFLYIPVFYFAAAMVAERQFMVFGKGNLLTLCLLAAILFNSFWMVRKDALGIITYVPDPKQVKTVEIYMDGRGYYNSVTYNAENFDHAGMPVNATEDITLVTEAHALMLRNVGFTGKGAMAYLTYTMKSGIKVRRFYPVTESDSAYEKLDKAASTASSIFGLEDWETFQDQVYYIEAISHSSSGRSYYFTDDSEMEVPGGDVKILGKRLRKHMLKLLKRDAEKGDLSQINGVKYYVTVKYRDDRGRDRTRQFTIPSILNGSESFLDICWDSIRGQADRTITDETPLYQSDSYFLSGGGSDFYRIPYYIID